MLRRNGALLACVLLTIWVFAFCNYFARNVSPLGQGYDELNHLDYSYFWSRKPETIIDVGAGLLDIGKAPLGQGHQAPFSYWLESQYLKYSLPHERSPFIDVAAGLVFSSRSKMLSPLGEDYCHARESPELLNTVHVASVRSSLKDLRTLNAFYFSVSIFIVYLLGRLLFPTQPYAQFALPLLVASTPTAIWRSVYVTNDNLSSLLGILSIYLSFLLALRATSFRTLLSLLTGLVLGLAMLSKYTAVVCAPSVFLILLFADSCAIKKRITSCLIVASAAGLILLPDLLTNLRIDGSLFSTSVIARAVPFLYYPTPPWKLLTQADFVRSLMESFWINFTDLGFEDPKAPFFAIYYCRAFGLASILGCCLALATRTWKSANHKVAFTISVFGLLAGIVLFCIGTSPFPIASGRYLHSLLPAVVIILYSGFSALLRKPQFILCFLSLNFLFVQVLIAQYFLVRFPSCRLNTEYAVPPGITFVAGDLDAKEGDEFMMYQRAKNRVYFARWNEDLRIQTSWTRVVGLPGDQLVFADVDDHPGADLIMRRPFYSQLFYASGKDVLTFNEKLHFQEDRAIRFNLITDFSFDGDEFGTFDADNDGKSGLYIYNRTSGTLYLRLGVLPIPNRVRQFEVPKDLISLAFYSTEGELFMLGARTSQVSKYKIEPQLPAQHIWTSNTAFPLAKVMYSPINQSVVAIGDGECVLIDKNDPSLTQTLGCPKLNDVPITNSQLTLAHTRKREYLGYFDQQDGNISLQPLVKEDPTQDVSTYQLEW